MKYYWLNEDTSAYGIINVTVASMRLQPIYQSELVNQLILGMIVPIFEEQNDFHYVQNWDSYFGWINKNALVVGDKAMAEKWHNAKRAIVVENYGVVRKRNDLYSEVIADLAPCAVLKRIDGDPKFTEVELPDGRSGLVETNIIIDEKNQLNAKANRESIVRTSKRFLGIPYLWGGTSAKGFDCSGFVQTVFRLLNVELPRDAKKMAEVGREIQVKEDFSNLEVGDLLFFGKTLMRMTHVAISLGGGLFIHAEGSVRINSLYSDVPIFNEYRHKTFLKAKRIM